MVSEYPWAFLAILPFVGLLKVLNYLLVLAVLMVVLLLLEGALQKPFFCVMVAFYVTVCKIEYVYPLKWLMC